MPLGLMVSDYGENPADTVSSAGSVAAAGKRNFWVRKGDVVVRPPTPTHLPISTRRPPAR